MGGTFTDNRRSPTILFMKHIKQAMRTMAKGKVDAYRALQRIAVLQRDTEEVNHLQIMIDEWEKTLRFLEEDDEQP